MSCKILYLIERLGVHESRWLTSLQKHELDVEVCAFHQLSTHPLPADRLILTGPLTTAARHLDALKHVPYVLMSYAYDVLLPEEEKGQSDQLIQELYSHSRGVIYDCEYVRSFCEAKFFIQKPSCVAAWGLEPLSATQVDPCFTQKVSELQEKYKGKTLIFSARNFSPIHGVPDIIEAYGKVSDAVLFIAGGGELEGEILESCSILPSHQPVEFLGSLTEAELCYAYQQLADIYVSASHVDGISISLLQAMQANCLLVLSEVGGNHDIPPSPFLRMFPAKDPTSLSQALISSQGMVSQLPAQCWQNVLETIGNWEVNQKTVVAFLESRYLSEVNL